MADKEQVIIEVTYDTTEAQKNVENLTKDVVGLENANKDLKKQLKAGEISQEEYSKAVESNRISLAKNKAERKDNIKFLKAEAGSLDGLKARNAALVKQRNKISTATKAGRDQISKLNKEYDKNSKAIAKNTNGLEKQKSAIGDYPAVLGTSINGIKGMTKAALAFVMTPLGFTIAAIVAGLKLLTTYFNSSEEGQNALNKASKVFSVVLGNIQDIAASVGEAIFNAFNNPKETIREIGEFLKTQIINRFWGLLELIPQLSKAIGKLFKGDFKEAGKIAADAVAKAGLGVEDFTDKAVKGFGKAKDALNALTDETRKEMAEAQKLADLQAELDIKEREMILKRAKLNAEISEARRIASDEENYLVEERIAAIERVQEAEDALSRQEVEIFEQRAYIKERENEFSNSTKEDLTELENLRARAFEAQTKRDNTQLRLLRERNRLIREQANEQKALTLVIDEKLDVELAAIEEGLDAELEALNTAYDANVEHEEALTRLQIEQEEFRRSQIQRSANIAINSFQEILAFRTNALEQQKQKELANEELTEEERVAIRKKYGKQQQKIQITQAIIAGSIAVLNALSTVPFVPAGVAAGIAAGISTGLQISTIKNQTFAEGGAVKMGTFGGRSHSMGGTKGVFSDGTSVEVERDENFYVLKKDASDRINALSSINESFGGRAFGTGKVAHAAQGGQMSTASPETTQSDVQEEIARTPIVVQVVDIMAGITANQSANEAAVV